MGRERGLRQDYREQVPAGGTDRLRKRGHEPDLWQDTVGGYITVESDSYENAVAIAKGCPILENGGSVEVREVLVPGTQALPARYLF